MCVLSAFFFYIIDNYDNFDTMAFKSEIKQCNKLWII